MNKLAVTLGGYGIAVVLFVLLLMAREDIGEIREQCNTDKAMAVAEAERVSRETLQGAHLRQLERLRQQAKREAEARDLADMFRSDAEISLAAAKAEINRLIREDDASIETQCLSVTVPDGAVNSLR